MSSVHVHSLEPSLLFLAAQVLSPWPQEEEMGGGGGSGEGHPAKLGWGAMVGALGLPPRRDPEPQVLSLTQVTVGPSPLSPLHLAQDQRLQNWTDP